MTRQSPPDQGPGDWPDLIRSNTDGLKSLPSAVEAALGGPPLQAPTATATGRSQPTGGVTLSDPTEVSTWFVPVRKPDHGFTFVEVVCFTDSPHAEQFALVWIIETGHLGAYDGHHYELYVFPDTTWDQIRSDPDEYLNAQWGDTRQYINRQPPGRLFTPEADRPTP